MFGKKKIYTCDKCGAEIEAAGSICPSCKSYIFTNRKDDFHCFEPDVDTVSGAECYVCGIKLHDGEYPVRIGRMALDKSLVAEEGWLILTDKRILFVTLKGKLAVDVQADTIRSLDNSIPFTRANLIFHDTSNKKYSFIATQIGDWAKKIREISGIR